MPRTKKEKNVPAVMGSVGVLGDGRFDAAVVAKGSCSRMQRKRELERVSGGGGRTTRRGHQRDDQNGPGLVPQRGGHSRSWHRGELATTGGRAEVEGGGALVPRTEPGRQNPNPGENPAVLKKPRVDDQGGAPASKRHPSHRRWGVRPCEVTEARGEQRPAAIGTPDKLRGALSLSGGRSDDG